MFVCLLNASLRLGRVYQNSERNIRRPDERKKQKTKLSGKTQIAAPHSAGPRSELPHTEIV